MSATNIKTGRFDGVFALPISGCCRKAGIRNVELQSNTRETVFAL